MAIYYAILRGYDISRRITFLDVITSVWFYLDIKSPIFQPNHANNIVYTYQTISSLHQKVSGLNETSKWSKH